MLAAIPDAHAGLHRWRFLMHGAFAPKLSCVFDRSCCDDAMDARSDDVSTDAAGVSCKCNSPFNWPQSSRDSVDKVGVTRELASRRRAA